MEQQHQKSTSLNNHKTRDKEDAAQDKMTAPVRNIASPIYRRFAENYDQNDDTANF